MPLSFLCELNWEAIFVGRQGTTQTQLGWNGHSWAAEVAPAQWSWEHPVQSVRPGFRWWGLRSGSKRRSGQSPAPTWLARWRLRPTEQWTWECPETRRSRSRRIGLRQHFRRSRVCARSRWSWRSDRQPRNRSDRPPPPSVPTHPESSGLPQSERAWPIARNRRQTASGLPLLQDRRSWSLLQRSPMQSKQRKAGSSKRWRSWRHRYCETAALPRLVWCAASRSCHRRFMGFRSVLALFAIFGGASAYNSATTRTHYEQPSPRHSQRPKVRSGSRRRADSVHGGRLRRCQRGRHCQSGQREQGNALQLFPRQAAFVSRSGQIRMFATIPTCLGCDRPDRAAASGVACGGAAYPGLYHVVFRYADVSHVRSRDRTVPRDWASVLPVRSDGDAVRDDELLCRSRGPRRAWHRRSRSCSLPIWWIVQGRSLAATCVRDEDWSGRTRHSPGCGQCSWRVLGPLCGGPWRWNLICFRSQAKFEIWTRRSLALDTSATSRTRLFRSTVRNLVSSYLSTVGWLLLANGAIMEFRRWRT